MKKLSQRHLRKLKKLSKRSWATENLISKMRAETKKDPGVIEMFKDYGVSLDEIDAVHIEFCDLGVSAKTKNRKIYINEKMLDDINPLKMATPYLVHEITHYLQQSTGKNVDGGEDYLDKDTEQEAFQAQISFKERNEGEEEAEEYVDSLLDHHDIKGKERKEKKEELMEGD